MLYYYIRPIKKKDLLYRNANSQKSMFIYALCTWMGLLLHESLDQCDVAWRPPACGAAEVIWKNKLI